MQDRSIIDANKQIIQERNREEKGTEERWCDMARNCSPTPRVNLFPLCHQTYRAPCKLHFSSNLTLKVSINRDDCIEKAVLQKAPRTHNILRRRVQRARAPLPLMPNFPQSLTPPSAIHFTHIFIQPTSYTFAHPQMLTLSHTIHFIISMISLYRLYYTFVLDRILFRASIQSIFNNSAECTVISVNMPTPWM